MKDNIILIAATNRPDILDPALLRPGRFDRQIVVDRPDRNGRRKILEVHSKGKPLAPEIDLDALAGGTPGFTGADLANLVNEAALLAARHGKKVIGQDDLEEGIMRVIAGPEKKARLLSEKEQRITAYHEMGHALVGHFLENTDPVHKITIVSRGQALGLTISLPTEDRYIMGKTALIETIAMTLGGRAAEDLVFHEITTGASNDLEKVTDIAKRMVMRYGMSDKLGPRVLGRNADMPFLGREMGHEPDYSDEIAREIDDEVRRIIEEGHELALKVLREHMDDLHRISQILIERETIDKDQFVRLLAGETEDAGLRARGRRPSRSPSPSRSARSPRQPRPFPLPGSAMQPPEPEGANSASRRQSGGEPQAPDRRALPPPERDGRDQRDAGLVLRRRRPPPAGRRGGVCARDARRGRGDRRRRRRVDPAGVGRGSARPGARPRRARARRTSRPAGVDRHREGGGGTAGSRARRRARERRDRPSRRPGARRGDRRRGRLLLPDAHARRAADDAGRPPSTTTWSRTSRPSSRSGSRSPSRRGSARSSCASTPGSDSGRRPSTTSSSSAGCPSWSSSGAR